MTQVRLNQSPIYYESQHKETEIFTHAAQHALPVLIKGPTGCGKTRFVEHMAELLNRPIYTVSCHDDLSATDLVGRHLVDHKGTFWQDGPLTRAVREGAICYLDEIIEARKDTTVVLHSLSDHRRTLHIERTGETLVAHKDFMLVVSYNPVYQNFIKGLKPSTRQRFVALTFNYPTAEKEARILQRETGIDDLTASQLVKLAQDIRRMADAGLHGVGAHDVGLQATVSTRLLAYASMMIKSGCTVKEACLHCVIEPLTDEADSRKALSRLVDAHF